MGLLPGHMPPLLALSVCVGLAFAPAGTVAGMVGVAVTGVILDHAGGATHVVGWYQAHAACAAVCVAAAFVFNLLAKGERVFD